MDLRKTVPGAQPFLPASLTTRSAGFVFDRLATAADWWLDRTQITGAVNDAASRAAAEDHDLAALQEMFAMILPPAPHHRLPHS
ncbi:hypothetical protein [uncultured Kocuria sp.]|uniref:hypothetical protein n=1 Tax=uncultured Kocuria sp. TaxID=259305 RepID=UPI00262B08CA|nr:hypothetical protein [uncultured Kocuria sp.]